MRPAAAKAADAVEDELPRLGVQADRRLVEQDQAWVEHQRAGQLDLLLLAPGQRAGVLLARAARRSGTPRPPALSALPMSAAGP